MTEFADKHKAAQDLGTKETADKETRVRTYTTLVGVLLVGVGAIIGLTLMINFTLGGDGKPGKARTTVTTSSAGPIQKPLEPTYRTIKAPSYKVLPSGQKPKASEFPEYEAITGQNCLHFDRGNFWVKTLENGVDVVRHRSHWSRASEKDEGKLEDFRFYAFLSADTRPLSVGIQEYPPGYRSGDQVICEPVARGKRR